MGQRDARRARRRDLALVIFYFPPTRRSRGTRAYRRRWTREKIGAIGVGNEIC